eukprot:3624915-Pleurochrysis_carterae.AAC.1
MLRESPMSEMAKQSLRFCPPESCHAFASARCVRPTLESISPTADSRLSPLRPLSEPKRRRWRRGERESKTTFVCAHARLALRRARIQALVSRGMVQARLPLQAGCGQARVYWV